MTQDSVVDSNKRIIVAGSPYWLMVEGQYEDDEIRNYAESFYGWREVDLVRRQSYVLVQPRED